MSSAFQMIVQLHFSSVVGDWQMHSYVCWISFCLYVLKIIKTVQKWGACLDHSVYDMVMHDFPVYCSLRFGLHQCL